MARGDGIHRTSARNARMKDADIGNAQAHNEREKSSYVNQDIVPERTPYNVHFKTPTAGYKEMFEQMRSDGVISTRGLKADAEKFGELIFDVNSAYFFNHGGYEFAKQFYADAYKAAIKIVGGEQYVLSAVMHADERNRAMSDALGQDVYHYHLHVIYIPVVEKQILWSKRCKDKSLVGTVKETIQQVSMTAQINDVAEYDISERLKETFGVDVSGVDIGAIEIDKSSDGYRQLMAVTKDITATKVQAETMDYVERLRIQREEGQYAMHKQTQTANIGAFQVEKHTEVGIAGAEALGHMGENGAGGVDLGNGGTGFNPAAMMAGMALGGAVGQNIAGIMNNSMAGVNQTAPSGATPPPVPVVAYHVAVNGQATGPFDLNVLQQMATSGQFNADSLVWKNGMPEWVKAGTIDELKSMFVVMPPIPPVE